MVFVWYLWVFRGVVVCIENAYRRPQCRQRTIALSQLLLSITTKKHCTLTIYLGFLHF